MLVLGLDPPAANETTDPTVGREALPQPGAAVKARGLAVEDFGGGIVGFRLPEEGAEVEAPKSTPVSGRRRKAS